MRRLRRHDHGRGRRGSALVIALFSMATLAALGAAFLAISTSTSRRQRASVDGLQAFYLAESGLSEAFQAVRMGRSGQVGSEAAPAAFGDGLVWVDATETTEGLVRLEATGLYGRGRSSLAFVIEPVEIPLGFFSDEDLVIESVLMVDGYDSGEAPYVEVAEVAMPEELVELRQTAATLDATSGRSKIEHAIECESHLCDQARIGDEDYDGNKHVVELAENAGMDPAELAADWAALEAAYYDGTLFADQTPVEGAEHAEAAADPFGDVAHTGSGGLLGSNGDVRFETSDGEPVAVYGDVRPGPGGRVLGLTEDVTIEGATDARGEAVDLPEVVVPDIALAPAFRHASPLPALISGGATGYTRIEVAADAELVVRGPATLVVGELVLEDGAALTLDTRDGDVALYVTGGMDLQPGSAVEATEQDPSALTVQVADIPSASEPAVQLEATSQFHGTIYAPDADVYLGSEFEVYGGVVARRLEIGAGAKLHFDNADLDDTPVPHVVSWRVVEVPAAVRSRRANPFQLLGVEPESCAALSEAHDLDAVMLSIVYEDHSGAQTTYMGAESDFDWDDVGTIVVADRTVTRELEESNSSSGSTEETPPTEPPPDEPVDDRTDVMDAIRTLPTGELKDFLLSRSPLTERELAAVLESDSLATSDLATVLIASSPLSDPELTKVINQGAMNGSDLRSTLAASAPLSELVLSHLLVSDGLTGSETKDVLVGSSPLSDAFLDRVVAAGVLSPSDLGAVLEANGR